jgi:hypothetical protein
MNNYEKIKGLSIEEMSVWLENYTRSIIITLANQMIESSKPEMTSNIEFKKFLLSEVE